MTADHGLALPEDVGVVNVGLPLFAAAVAAQGRPSVQVDWRIPAAGDPVAVAALRRLSGPRTEQVDAANAEVARRLDTGVPMLVDVRPAAEVLPRLGGRVLLHPGPAVELSQVCDPLRRSLRVTALAEGWCRTLDEADALLEVGRGDPAPRQRRGRRRADGRRRRPHHAAVGLRARRPTAGG